MSVSKLTPQTIYRESSANLNRAAEPIVVKNGGNSSELAASPGLDKNNSENTSNRRQIFDQSALLRERLFQSYAKQTEEPPPSGGLTAEQANLDPEGDDRQVFITQYQTDDYNPDGNATGGNDCGPTSAAMALDAVGLQLPGTIQETIDLMRDESGIADGLVMGLGDIKTAVETVEGASAERGNGWDALDDALAAGNSIVLGGDISENWVNNFNGDDDTPDYSSDRSGGHFIAVLGVRYDESNNPIYTVADPLSSGGAVEMTREQLAEFCDPVNSENVRTGFDSDGDGDPVDFLIISNSSNAAVS